MYDAETRAAHGFGGPLVHQSQLEPTPWDPLLIIFYSVHVLRKLTSTHINSHQLIYLFARVNECVDDIHAFM